MGKYLLTLFIIIPLLSLAQSNTRFRHITIDDGLAHTDATCFAQDKNGFIWLGTNGGLQRYDGNQLRLFFNKMVPKDQVYNNRIYDIKIIGSLLWVATEGGLHCFDMVQEAYVPVTISGDMQGNKFRKITHIKVLKDELLVQGDFTVYRCVYNAGLSTLETFDIKKQGENLTEAFRDFEIRGLASDGQSVFWVSGNSTIYTFKLANGKATLINSVNSKQRDIGLINGLLNSLTYADHKLWVVAFKRMQVIDLSRDHTQFRSSLKTIEIQDWLEGYDVETNQLSLHGVELDGYDNFWAITQVGLLSVKNPLSEHPIVEIFQYSLYDPNAISSNHINSLFIDRSNCLWIGTWGGGASYLDLGRKKFHKLVSDPFKSENSLNGPFVRAIVEDAEEDDLIWIGTKSSGINVFDQKTGRCLSLADYFGKEVVLSSNDIRSLLSIKGKLIIGTVQGGINVLDKKTGDNKFIRHDSNIPGLMSAIAIYCLTEDKFGHVWAGSWGSGVYKLAIKNGAPVVLERYKSSTEQPFNSLSSDIVTSLLYDEQKNELLAGSNYGLNRLMLDENGLVKRIIQYRGNETPQSLTSEYVWPVVKKNDSVFWVGTLGGGLNRMVISDEVDQQGLGIYKAHGFTMDQGAPGNDIEALLLDNEGSIWVSGKGISKFFPDIKEFWNFDVNDGLQGNDFKIGAACKTRSGYLYFGGIKGLNYFDPLKIYRNAIPPQVAITGLKIMNDEISVNERSYGRVVLQKSLAYTKEIHLTYLENDFSFSFSSLHYANPEKCRFKYILEGYDQQWQYINGSFPLASYSNLKYGEYTFKVDATNNDGLWSGKPVAISVRISPPWWLSTVAISVYIVLFFLLLISIYYYLTKWITLKNNLKLIESEEARKEELHQYKLQFFTNISHEFKTPLTLILSPIEKLQESDCTAEERKNLIQLISQNAHRMLTLINELMEFRKAEVGKLNLASTKEDLSEFISGVGGSFVQAANQKGVAFSCNISEEVSLWFDKEKMSKIILNLFSNALKFTNDKGEIKVEVFEGSKKEIKPFFPHWFVEGEVSFEKYAYVRVVDTGIGISPESLSQIFDRFYHTNLSAQKHLGSGIGLALVKSLVSLHYGYIMVSSEREKGSEFVVAFPLGEKHLRAEEKLVSQGELPLSQVEYAEDFGIIDDAVRAGTVGSKPEDSEGLPSLLIVEDNEELRKMLVEHYRGEFKVSEAADGKQGLALAKELVPDLIISDIMMPEMDGMEMTKHIRSEMETSHVPVLLLTARSSMEHQIEGAESGANVYMSKPFSLKLLDIKVRNLIETQQRIKERYASDVFASTREVVKNKKDQDFLDVLIDIIDRNMDNNEFSVTQLCQELALGRTNLYKKIKSLTGQSLGEFIRGLRLKKAARILLSEDVSITEVIYRVGINSNSYFTKAFKAQFGVTPSEFVQKEGKID